MKAWFEEHFQEDYLKVYDHRDEEKAAAELHDIMNHIPLKAGMKAIDLCCGNGRHARYMAGTGIHVTALDLSPVLLKKAVDLTFGLPVQYMRGDVRHISLKQEYDAAFNLFTSFGYFVEDYENELVIVRASEALKDDGWFCFDYLNPVHTAANLVPYDSTDKNGFTVSQKRYIENGFIHKKISIEENGSRREYRERVKMYSNDTLKQMLRQNGFDIEYLFGDYDASPFEEQSSPRQIFICRKRPSQ